MSPRSLPPGAAILGKTTAFIFVAADFDEFCGARLRAKRKNEETGNDSCFHHLEPSNRVGIFLQKMIDVNAVAFG